MKWADVASAVSAGSHGEKAALTGSNTRRERWIRKNLGQASNELRLITPTLPNAPTNCMSNGPQDGWDLGIG